MSRHFAFAVICSLSLISAAEPTCEVVDGRCVLTVPEGTVTVDIAAEDLAEIEAERRTAPFTLLTATDGGVPPTNAFAVSERVRKARWYLVREGNTLSLASGRDLTVILR